MRGQKLPHDSTPSLANLLLAETLSKPQTRQKFLQNISYGQTPVLFGKRLFKTAPLREDPRPEIFRGHRL
jgi:hypothetical protein